MTHNEQHGYAAYDGRSHKYLSSNRDRYIAQSAATRNGVVAELPPRDFDPNPPSPEEVAEAAEFKYG